jgi:hypothetical protein
MTRLPRVETRRDRFLRWYFCDDNGDLVLAEPPNRRAKAFYGLRGTRWVLHRTGLSKGSPLDVVLDGAGTLVMVVWAADELLRGTTRFRRTIGALALLSGLRHARLPLGSR